MTHMRVERIAKALQRKRLRYCSNGCQTAARPSHKHPAGRREATHIMWLLGHAVLVCAPCAKAMAEAYESATREAVYGGTEGEQRAEVAA